MTLSDLTSADLRRRLRTAGLVLRVGSYRYRIHSNLRSLVPPLHALYADFEIEEGEFADFHVNVAYATGGRLLFRGANLYLDGTPRFDNFPPCRALAYFEWGLNRCLYRRPQNHLMGHAAALERGGGALMLMGEPGAGKSTLCAALVLDGWRLLSDELSLLSLDSGQLAALARPIILKNESISLIGGRAGQGSLGPVIHGTSKGSVAHLRPPTESVRRIDETARPRRLAFVRYAPRSPLEVRPVSRGDAFIRFARGSFNYGDLGAPAFYALAEMIDACDCFELTYSDLDEAVAFFAGSDSRREGGPAPPVPSISETA